MLDIERSVHEKMCRLNVERHGLKYDFLRNYLDKIPAVSKYATDHGVSFSKILLSPSLPILSDEFKIETILSLDEIKKKFLLGFVKKARCIDGSVASVLKYFNKKQSNWRALRIIPIDHFSLKELSRTFSNWIITDKLGISPKLFFIGPALCIDSSRLLQIKLVQINKLYKRNLYAFLHKKSLLEAKNKKDILDSIASIISSHVSTYIDNNISHLDIKPGNIVIDYIFKDNKYSDIDVKFIDWDGEWCLDILIDEEKPFHKILNLLLLTLHCKFETPFNIMGDIIKSHKSFINDNMKIFKKIYKRNDTYSFIVKHYFRKFIPTTFKDVLRVVFNS
jgi:hypothetical protein